MQNLSLEEAKQLALIVQAMNYQLGLQNFTVVFIFHLQDMYKIVDELKTISDSVQVAVCGLTSRHTGMNMIELYLYCICRTAHMQACIVLWLSIKSTHNYLQSSSGILVL